MVAHLNLTVTAEFSIATVNMYIRESGGYLWATLDNTAADKNNADPKTSGK